MLAASGAANTSGKSVTTLIVSIAVLDCHQLVAPRLDRLARLHALEADQPLAVIRATAGHHQRSREHAVLVVHDVEPRLGSEDFSRVFHEGQNRHLPVLPVRLAQPPDYAGRLASTPALRSSERAVSDGWAPFSNQARACSAFTLIVAGVVRGVWWPIVASNPPSPRHRRCRTTNTADAC